MNGILIIDKPQGPTSNQITLWIKQLLNEKTCHAGTLDPNVSGVLPILIGKAIKLQEYLQTHDKTYVCLTELAEERMDNEIQEAMHELTGKIYQTPPEMSAVKKAPRIRKIYDIKILEKQGKNILFEVYCQHGTYIRTLVDHLGHLLGTKAKMTELRRIKTGPFTEKEAIILTKIRDYYELGKIEQLIKPVEYAVQKMPKIQVKETAEQSIKKGAGVAKPGIINIEGHIVKDTPVAIMSKEKLIAMGESLYNKKQMTEKTKGIMIKTKKVF